LCAHAADAIFCAQVPAYLLMGLADTVGRRRTWAGFLLVGALSLASLAILHHLDEHGSFSPPAPSPSPSPSPPPPPVPRRMANGGAAAASHAAPHAAHAAARSASAHRRARADDGSTPLSMVLFVLGLAARFGATGASAVAYVCAAEQWPTSCRNLGVNYGATCGRVGSILSPLLWLLPMPMAMLGAIAAAAAIGVLGLPETRGAQLAETLAEAPAEPLGATAWTHAAAEQSCHLPTERAAASAALSDAPAQMPPRSGRGGRH
jgi:MFS family permease